jgi:hypothetical protein
MRLRCSHRAKTVEVNNLRQILTSLEAQNRRQEEMVTDACAEREREMSRVEILTINAAVALRTT